MSSFRGTNVEETSRYFQNDQYMYGNNFYGPPAQYEEGSHYGQFSNPADNESSNLVSDGGSHDIPVSQDSQLSEFGESVEGQLQETVSEATGLAGAVVPMLNQSIMTDVNRNQLDLSRQGFGEYGTAVGHQIVDQQQFNNKQLATSIGTGIMAAGFATGDPIIGALGLAAGVAEEMIAPSMMQNDNVLNSTSGDLVAPQ